MLLSFHSNVLKYLVVFHWNESDMYIQCCLIKPLILFIEIKWHENKI